MKISYCTSCYNRLWQLVQTIEYNLSFTKSGEIELCVLSYNDDSVEPYLYTHYSTYINDGRLKVQSHYDNYKPLDGSDFACGYVKNLSHALGTGEILFNLDADNFIEPQLQESLLNLKPHEVLRSTTGKFEGSLGRIGVHKSLYKKVNGYRDVGRSDDGDFIMRCLKARARLINTHCGIEPLSNYRSC